MEITNEKEKKKIPYTYIMFMYTYYSHTKNTRYNVHIITSYFGIN